jgi:hypothetical protein
MANAPADTGPGADGLLQMLEQQGWQAQSAADGSLIFRPPGPRTTPDQGSAPTGEPGAEPAQAETQEIERLLLERGWRTKTDTAGNTLLIPVRTTADETPRVELAGPETAAETGHGKTTTQPFSQFQRALSSTGWLVRPAPDGSMTIFPPGSANEPSPERPGATGDGHGHCAGVILTAVTQGEISLPIDGPDKAARLATDWIADFGHADTTLGRIRQINHLYVVSIVDRASPHLLRNQLIIRSENGGIIATR